MREMIQSFGELPIAQQPLAGGKGGALARLYQAGYPVPDGFVILPTAFVGDKLRPEAWAQVETHLARIRAHDQSTRGADEGIAFAVRSSALSEDSAFASFAGEFETVLDVHSDEMVRDAIHTVRRSRHSERVRAYSEAKGMDPLHGMAVVVQRLVRADISGVLFTANPVTGSRAEMTGNFVYGFGEKLVSGEAEPYTFMLKRPRGQYDGPPTLRGLARKLLNLGSRLEKELGCPQDIEWAIAGGKLLLLQSRPITTLVGHDPATGEWNATFTGDYLWTNVMNVEIFPLAARPSTWSVWQILFDRLSMGPGHPSFGNIAGRFYVNYSMMYSMMMKIMRKHERVMQMLGDTVGLPPQGMDIPPYAIPMRTLLLELIPREMRNESTKRRLKKDRPEFLATIPGRCRRLRQQISETEDKAALVSLWLEETKPLFVDLFTLQDALNEDFSLQNRGLRKDLRDLLGEKDANALLSTVGSGSDRLASIGPLLGLSKLTSGKMDREEYLERYGHRGAYENYLFMPRPYEEPAWLDRQIEEFNQSPVDVTALLGKRDTEFNAVWERLKRKMAPRKERAMRRRIDEMAETCVAREATRSELTRVTGVIRDIFLRAGQVTGLRDDVFFLTIDELVDVLSGNEASTAYISARRGTHDRYGALPPLPNWIRGRFDPSQWAEDPDRRTDVFDANAPASSLKSDDIVEGNPGSAGRVEGVVRCIDSPDEGEQLAPGEVLVTSATNVGWTPLFPRAAAIVTDIGGALSHAAIVAREIGIPAVVGCRTATMRLRTGDRVRVDGGQGIVEILSSAGR